MACCATTLPTLQSRTARNISLALESIGQQTPTTNCRGEAREGGIAEGEQLRHPISGYQIVPEIHLFEERMFADSLESPYQRALASDMPTALDRRVLSVLTNLVADGRLW